MRNFWRLFSFAKSLWKYYLVISFFTVLLAILNQLYPIFTKGAIDQITKLSSGGKVDLKIVVVFVILIFVSDLASTLVSNVSGYLGDMMSVKLQKFMSQRYYEHLLSLPQTYFDKELTGKIINRMNRGINQITNFVQTITNNFLQFIFSTIFSLIIVAFYSWQVALMLLLIYPIFIFLTTKTSKRWQKYQAKINENLDIASGRFAESVGQIKVVKSFIQEVRELKYFENKFTKVIKITKPQSILWHKQDLYRRSVLSVIFFFIFMYIFVEAANGKFSIGTVVLLIQYAMLIRIPIFSISFLVDQSQRAVANTKDYFEVMDTAPELIDHPGSIALKVTNAQIDFKDVFFSYDSVPVLDGISFTLKPGTRVALVGESGEGKTTITNLIMRLYEPQAGTILIDDQNVADVTQASLRDNIGVVFQEPFLFSGTIKENISYSNSGASTEEVVSAAKAANADEFIEKFENGYDTEIGERGLKLSGGQKQRIAIARALLKDAPILILDEATSSLDSRSEKMVHEALNRLMENRTTLIIAHRLSTIENVDKIITLRSGKVDEVGSPQELSKTGGIYAQLLKLQLGKTEASEKKLKSYDIAG